MKGLLKRLLAGPAASDPARAHAGEDRKTDWKARTGEALARVKSLETELRQQARRMERYQEIAEKLQKRDAQYQKLRERLAAAERELAVAREHLMTVEAKLDILEGAANVLDARTRSAVRPKPRETGAPV